MSHSLQLPTYDAALNAFLDGSAAVPGHRPSPSSLEQPAWTELWAARSRRPDHTHQAYVVTHGLPCGQV